ncbi:MAG: hypothetical protein ACHP7M_12310 [Burkholderiales bacterium]
MHALQEVRGVERRVRQSMFILIAGCALASGAASATSFPVSGTISVNGNPGTLPSGGSFGPNSSYDAASGAIAAGRFMFPVATTTFHSDALGVDVTVTYQLSQTNTSTGQVAGDGVAALTQAQLKLKAISALVGFVPISFGETCIFQPIDLALAGSGAASGLDLADTGFTIPQVAPTDCGGWGSQINNGIAGTNNSLQTHWTGNFTPPTGNDLIFANGFDPG